MWYSKSLAPQGASVIRGNAQEGRVDSGDMLNTYRAYTPYVPLCPPISPYRASLYTAIGGSTYALDEGSMNEVNNPERGKLTQWIFG